jgi:SAM-dependent methyltransferase
VTLEKDKADLGALAKLFAGQSAGEQEDLEAVRELFVKCGLPPHLSRKLLERSIENPQIYLIRLLALRIYFDKASALDPEAATTIRDLERQIEFALWPPRADSDEAFDVPVRFRRGALTNNQKASVDSAVTMIAATARELGVADLSGTTILDIGCGTKFTQAFYGRKIPVKRYHGVDVDPDMIAFLSSAVKDERFSYKHIDVYNERYHTAGKRLSADTDLGVPGETFDLICLFSVFTHLEPSDYQAMLELTRRRISPSGTLIFTSFIDNGLSEDFKDRDPEQPLHMALYRENAVREFARAARWSVNKIFLPGAQHWVVCTPTDNPPAS